MNQIFKPADLLEQTLAYAHQLVASVSPNSLQTRWQIYRLHRDVASSVVESERLIADMATEEDFREGISAVGAASGLAFGAVGQLALELGR